MNHSLSLVAKAKKACIHSDWPQAKALFLEALRQNRNSVHALHGLGVVSLQSNQPLRAVLLLERAQNLQLRSDSPSITLIEALIFALNTAMAAAARSQNWRRVLSLGQRALELDPAQAHTLSNLATASLRLSQLEQALHWSKEALSLNPENCQILNNHGSILQERGDFEAAKLIYLQILEQEPSHSNALSNLACLKHQIGELSDAQALYKAHLSNHPDDTRVWVNLAGVLLSQNDWDEGWNAYQHRLDRPSPIMCVPPGLGLWQGPQEPITRLIVVHEQGLGDSFQFSRFLPGLHNHFSNIVFSGPSKLHELLKHSALVEVCWDPEDPHFQWHDQGLNAEDRWIPLMSLAPLLQHSRDIDYFNAPYLLAQPKSIKKWREKLRPSDDKPLLALHWQGNPEHEMTLSRGRSFALRQLEPLLNIEGPMWLSLQKGPGSEQLDELHFRHRFHPRQSAVDDCWNFQETAAILMNCDLVITSDSGLAHLAAGLGRPTWLLLMHIPEWRWGLEGAKTPWYPSMRLFRQMTRGDWKGVVKQQVRPALQHWLKQKSLQKG